MTRARRAGVVAAAAPPAAQAAPIATDVAEAAGPPKYDRDAFGDGWAPAGGGCNTRDVILRRDISAVTNSNRCGPLAGTLRDPYSGTVVVGPTRQLDIDHVVPLEYAWTHGAWQWTAAQREAFANDPRNLRATLARENRAKGSKGLGQWRPKNDPCGYARSFDTVADRYRIEDRYRDRQVGTACR